MKYQATLLALCLLMASACGDDDTGEAAPSATVKDVVEDTEADDRAPAGPRGTVSVEVRGLEDHIGDQLAGVLMLPAAAPERAVAGFAVVVGSDPFSTVAKLGNVSEAIEDGGLWPWPEGVASIPAGDYTLRVVLGDEYCCYSRWMPAADPGLRLCDVPVTIEERDEVIEITGWLSGPKPEGATCAVCVADDRDASGSSCEELS